MEKTKLYINRSKKKGMLIVKENDLSEIEEHSHENVTIPIKERSEESAVSFDLHNLKVESDVDYFDEIYDFEEYVKNIKKEEQLDVKRVSESPRNKARCNKTRTKNKSRLSSISAECISDDVILGETVKQEEFTLPSDSATYEYCVETEYGDSDEQCDAGEFSEECFSYLKETLTPTLQGWSGVTNDTSKPKKTRRKRPNASVAPTKCNLCSKPFKYLKNLKRHLHLQHAQSTYFTCDQCNKKFLSARALQIHSNKEHLGYDPRFCNICEKQFSTANYAQIHRRTHTGEKPYVCPTCGKRFTMASYLRMHSSTHSSEKPYVCTECGKGFPRADNLKVHERIHTGETPCECPVCHKCFSRSGKLHVHMRTHTGEKPYACALCDYKCSTGGGLKRHMYNIHTTHDDKMKFQCDVCPSRFTNIYSLKCHKRLHTGDGLHACGACNKKFVYSNTLERHIKIHTGERPYVCAVCNKAFTEAGSLRTHQRIHTGERPYECSLCQKAFRTNNDLRKHKLTHSAVRPYPCTMCDYRCVVPYALKSHMWRRHNVGELPGHVRAPPRGTKQFQCELCPTKFSRVAALKRHLRLHSGEGLLACDKCGKKFTCPSQLELHSRLHTGEKPFACDQCGKRFGQNGYLKVHLKRHEKQNEKVSVKQESI